MTLTFDLSKLRVVKNLLYQHYHIVNQAIKKFSIIDASWKYYSEFHPITTQLSLVIVILRQ